MGQGYFVKPYTMDNTLKNIIFRFANPVVVNGKILLDIQARANETLTIFGINLRFFYDTRLFKPALTTNTDFKLILEPGYKQYNPFNANSPTGWAMFGSIGPITYINTAVELTTPTKGIIVSGGWVKVLQFQVTPRVPLSSAGFEWPAFIFDKSTYVKPNPLYPNLQPGGFLNSDGITCTEYIKTEGGEMYTAPLTETCVHMNWMQDPVAVKLPWGYAAKTDLFTV